MILGPKGNPAFQEKLKSYLASGMLSNLTNKSNLELMVPVHYLIAYNLSAYIGIVQHWLNTGMKESPADLSKIMVRMTFKGSLNAAGIKFGQTQPDKNNI